MTLTVDSDWTTESCQHSCLPLIPPCMSASCIPQSHTKSLATQATTVPSSSTPIPASLISSFKFEPLFQPRYIPLAIYATYCQSIQFQHRLLHRYKLPPILIYFTSKNDIRSFQASSQCSSILPTPPATHFHLHNLPFSHCPPSCTPIFAFSNMIFTLVTLSLHCATFPFPFPSFLALSIPPPFNPDILSPSVNHSSSPFTPSVSFSTPAISYHGLSSSPCSGSYHPPQAPSGHQRTSRQPWRTSKFSSSLELTFLGTYHKYEDCVIMIDLESSPFQPSTVSSFSTFPSPKNTLILAILARVLALPCTPIAHPTPIHWTFQSHHQSHRRTRYNSVSPSNLLVYLKAVVNHAQL